MCSFNERSVLREPKGADRMSEDLMFNVLLQDIVDLTPLHKGGRNKQDESFEDFVTKSYQNFRLQ